MNQFQSIIGKRCVFSMHRVWEGEVLAVYRGITSKTNQNPLGTGFHEVTHYFPVDIAIAKNGDQTRHIPLNFLEEIKEEDAIEAPSGFKCEVSDLGQAIGEISFALKTDPGYRESWKANIAKCFVEAHNWYSKRPELTSINQIANEAAKRFVLLLADD